MAVCRLDLGSSLPPELHCGMRLGVQGDGGIPLGGLPGAGRDPITPHYLSLDVNNITQ